jgi:cyclohexanone monooxygenase
MLMPAGPQSGSASTNYPRGIETGVNWCTDFLEHVWRRDETRFEATAEAEARWTRHVVSMYEMMLMRKAKGWFTGYNSNVPGHEEGKVRYFVYNGGAPKYVATITKVAESGYEGVVFGSSGATDPAERRTRDVPESRAGVA